MIKSCENLNVKKKLMFIIDEDYNYITYNIFIILLAFKCNSPDRTFKDYRKLTYIIPMISYRHYLNIGVKKVNNLGLTSEEKKTLYELYYDSRLKLRIISSLLFSLEKRGLVHLIRKGNTIDLWIDNQVNEQKFLCSQIFKDELANYEILRSNIKYLKAMNNETLEERIFIENGVKLWEI